MKQLSKDEMKKVVGGIMDDGDNGSGTCCAHNENWSNYTCQLSKSMAQDNASAFGKWCCDSCANSYFIAMNTFYAMA